MGWGLLLDYCSGFVVCHNGFVDNHIQAEDGAHGSDIWDGGYPFGGNFWSDYHVTDRYCGPGQNLTGSDGIGDTPYQVGHDTSVFPGGGGIDRYPLVSEPV